MEAFLCIPACFDYGVARRWKFGRNVEYDYPSPPAPSLQTVTTHKETLAGTLLGVQVSHSFRLISGTGKIKGDSSRVHGDPKIVWTGDRSDARKRDLSIGLQYSVQLVNSWPVSFSVSITITPVGCDNL